MSHIQKNIFPVWMIFVQIVCNQCYSPKQTDEYYCNLLAGEPTQTSIVVVARLHRSDTLVNNDLKGIEGYLKFRITRDNTSKNVMESPFYHVDERNDYTAKYEFTGLRPGQKYYYCISYGRDTSNNTSSSWSNFSTLNLPVSDRNISFAVTNEIKYQPFNKEIVRPENASSFASLYSVLNSISFFNPDFLLGNAEIDYSDMQSENNTETKDGSKYQRHNLFTIPPYNIMLSHIPSFWILSGNPGTENSIFYQIPVNAINPDHPAYYRTYRLNRDVQIWILCSLFSNSDLWHINGFRIR